MRMPKLVIHQEKVEDPQVLVDICPFGAMEEKDGKLSINAACKMCKLCVKKGPAGAVEYVEDEKKEESANMKNGLNFARKVLATSECDLLVLDGILGVVDAGVISVEELCAIIRAKTEETDVILTGRRVPEELREIADEVYNIIAEK